MNQNPSEKKELLSLVTSTGHRSIEFGRSDVFKMRELDEDLIEQAFDLLLHLVDLNTLCLFLETTSDATRLFEMAQQVRLQLNEPIPVVRVLKQTRVWKRSLSHDLENWRFRAVRQVKLTTLPRTMVGVVRFVPTHTPKKG
jgi:hypothetical protein